MKIAILGDTHFGARGDSPHFHAYFKRFYDEVFFPYLEENGIDNVIQLGDVFDRRKFINFQTLKSCREYFFDPLNHPKYTSHLLVGNHDTFYKNTNDVNSLDLLLNQFSNIRQVQQPMEYNYNGTLVLMVPWICSENEAEVFKAMELSKAQICVGHFEISGFEMHKGALCDTGLSTKVFDKFDMVISGHFHTRSKSNNITYTGTPYEMTWADYDDAKGFHILDTSTRELTFVENPFTMFNKIHYDDVGTTLEELIAVDFSQYKNTIVKVIVRNKTNPFWFDTFIDKLEQVGLIDIKVVDDHLNLNLEDDEDIVSEAEDTLTILNKYVDQIDVNVNKVKLEKLLHTLYNEALSMESA